ncbi:MAG: hypothetical protein C4326_06580 [Ignavibacteria bacterium]
MQPEETDIHPLEHETVSVKAFDYASAYDLRKAREKLENTLGGKVLNAKPLLVQFDRNKLVNVFDYGSVVFFNVPPNEIEQVMAQLKQCAFRENKYISEDEFVLSLVPRQQKPAGKDVWYIKDVSRDIALIVGIVLSRSVSLEYYEKLVTDALAQFEPTVVQLATKGWIPRRGREATKNVGFALSVEHELAYDVAIFDDPDIVWDGGAKIEQLYRALKTEFNLEDRIKVIQQKVSIISRFSTFVLARLEAQRSAALELIIIILILWEILLAILGKI